MIRSIEIRDLRGIKIAVLGDFAPLTIIVGPNNAGKSTILDAIYLACSVRPEQTIQTILSRRTVSQPADWLLYRSRNGEADEAKITVKTTDGQVRLVEIIHPPNTNNVHVSSEYLNDPRLKQSLNTWITVGSQKKQLTTSPPPVSIPEVLLVDPVAAKPVPLHELYTRTVERGLRRESKAIIKDLIPSLEDVEILTQQGQPVVYLVFDDSAHPVQLAGEGIQLLLRMSFELAALPGAVVLLEEPEAHLHPAGLRQAARAVWAAQRRGIQIILSTHSLDLIDALLAESRSGELPDLSVYRVQLDHGTLSSTRLTGPEAAIARTQIESDLR